MIHVNDSINKILASRYGRPAARPTATRVSCQINHLIDSRFRARTLQSFSWFSLRIFSDSLSVLYPEAFFICVATPAVIWSSTVEIRILTRRRYLVHGSNERTAGTWPGS